MENGRLRIVIPGGSGQVGRMLASFFQERGHYVTVLTRGPYTANWQTVHWDGMNPGPWVETLEGADVVIHLSGKSVNCRATERNKRALYDSRIGPTRLLGRVIAGMADPPRLWMNASTATIYRHALDRAMDEATGEIGGGEMITKRRRAPEKWDWTIKLVKDWEAALYGSATPKTRRIAMRTSLVFSPTPGNIFAVLSNLVRFGLGGTQGNGRQYVSWMHEADYARAVEFLIEHEELEGAVNLASPNPIRNREFMAALREAWDMPNGLPAPAPLIQFGAIFLRTEPELVLKSRRVIPGKLLDAGFEFEFPEWAGAAEDLVRKWRKTASSQ
ncbi:MAG TPA: TIGR01777 family oxidoreductase [Terracidiphilus sp.]|nr:TIGR01777 family oxidoreductase [Terracidiphilus sp.]